MKTACMIVFISIAICVSFCYPSKPLNERSTELAWEAWLLVDQSNRQTDLGMLRKRITPKSVFIAPTFSPESLPACAEGYRSDMMGRCVKMFKFNESVHFDFLLQKINAQFADYDDVEETTATSGPFQLNIPLYADDEKLLENETDVAIVVTPASKHHRKNSFKVDVKRNGNEKFDVKDVAAILGVKPEEVEMTTMVDLSTTVAMSTTMSGVDDTTTTLQTTEPVTTVTTENPSTTENTESTTLQEGDALFFQIRV